MDQTVVKEWLSLNLKSQIEEILTHELPKFYTYVHVGKYKPVFTKEPIDYLVIGMAASDHEINGVKRQYPQHCTMQLEEGELSICMQGGQGGQHIDLIPNKEDPKECYLAIKGLKIPFRSPKIGNTEGILKAIRKFCQNYKAALIANKDRLYNADIVNYDSLLG